MNQSQFESMRSKLDRLIRKTLIIALAIAMINPNLTIAISEQENQVKMDALVVSEESLKMTGKYEVVYSNIDFVNALFNEYLYAEEISRDALKSYYVDYYLAQVNNGGFSQFVYNSGWKKETINLIKEGLQEMGAKQNYALFIESALILERLGEDKVQEFMDSEYFGENKERDILNAFSDKFFDLQEIEDLFELNHKWLTNHPNLKILPKEKIRELVASIANSIPDRKERIEASLAAEPRFMKIIRALCKKSGQELSHVTAGDPTHKYKGKQTLAWHFITDVGHHYMIDVDGKAILYNGSSNKEVTQLNAGKEFGVN